MAVELRLGPPDESVKNILIQQRGTFESTTYNTTYNEQYYSIIERMRTFVACYYVSSW